MKNVIYNYYNILISDMDKYGNNYFFYYNNYLYCFYLVFNDIKVVENINKYINENGIEAYEIIKNVNNSLFSEVSNQKYSLLKIKGLLKYIYYIDDFKFYPVNEIPHNWGKLWSDRLDYYEIQLRELGRQYQTVLNSFGMFSGLAENAILYYNLTTKNFKEDYVVGIVHNRMKYPCYAIDYNNPLNFIIDYHVRDIAEYIKSYMMTNEFELNNVINIISKLNLNNFMFNLLYSRLLYPTFYFDIFDKIILDNGNDVDVLVSLNILDKYLNMLHYLYIKFSVQYKMYNIEWINKM